MRWVWAMVVVCACGGSTSDPIDAGKDAQKDQGIDSPPPPKTKDGWEVDDDGDDPEFEGCVEVYATSDESCGGAALESFGDSCLDGVTLVEVLDLQCEAKPVTTRTYDCRTALKDSRATCVVVDDSCFPGNLTTGTKSAYCDAPFDFDAGPTDASSDGTD